MLNPKMPPTASINDVTILLPSESWLAIGVGRAIAAVGPMMMAWLAPA